jgi:hypothetical protein
MNDSSNSRSFRPFFLPSLILFFFGGGGLALLITQTRPTAPARWAGYALFALALAGAALPVIYFLHWRFPETPPAKDTVLVRQALSVSVYGTLLLWLQQWRMATTEIVFLLAIGFIVIEWLIRFRERSRWTPPPDESSTSQETPPHEI